MRIGFGLTPVRFGQIRQLKPPFVSGKDAASDLQIDDADGQRDTFRFRDLMGPKGTVRFLAGQQGQIFEIIRDGVRSPLRTPEELAQCQVLIPRMPVPGQVKINLMKALVNAGFYALLIHSPEEIRSMYESVGIPEEEIQQLLSEFVFAAEFPWEKSRLH